MVDLNSTAELLAELRELRAKVSEIANLRAELIGLCERVSEFLFGEQVGDGNACTTLGEESHRSNTASETAESHHGDLLSRQIEEWQH